MSRERLQRRLGVVQAPARALKTMLLFAALGAIAFGIAFYGRSPDLSHVKVAFLSGTERGNYYAVVQKMAGEAKRHRGRIDNIATAGSVENIAKLAAGKASCGVHFALVQDGLPWPPDDPFELIGRLPRSESLVLIGRNADEIKRVQDLRGRRIGVGPAGSGTEYVARLVLTQLTGLDIKASTHPLVEQLAKLESGELDLAAMVIDTDAQLLVEAVRDRNLQSRRHARCGGAREPPAVRPCGPHRGGPLRPDASASVNG
jgi:ABC-type nitrate/sulfonate/bicarbonate transport system substrate-binding protein